MTENEVLGWLRLQRIPGIGPVNGRRLVQHFGDVRRIFSQSKNDLEQVRGIGPSVVQRLLNPGFQREAEAEYEKALKKGIKCLPISDLDYPPLLRECTDAPLVIFKKGPISFPGNRFISIVGTRSMTAYGRRVCDGLLEALAPYDPVVVSGLASGVDVYAQRTALKAGLRTVSCLGHGLDSIYPAAHSGFAREILNEGALLSEFWLGTPAEPMNFVRRNRIIAGVSPATVVVESGPKGGSLITADLAFDYNREVFAVPGRITDHFSSGCNLLIGQQKAQLIQSAEQMAVALNWPEQRSGIQLKRESGAPRRDLSPEECRIAEYLKAYGVRLLDEIALACTLTVPEAASLLFQMEMKDLICAHPGKKYEWIGK